MAPMFRKAADNAMVASAVYAVYGAAVAYPARTAAATAFAFVLGYGVLLFLLPFSVYALVFLLAPRYLCKMTRSMQVCAVAAPASLLAAVLAVLGMATRAGGNGEVVALTAGAVWAVDAAAVAALGWCLTNGGYTAVAFSRQYQFANFMDALRRSPELGHSFFNIADPKVAKRDAARFVAAVSAACAVAGGAVVGGVSAGGGLSAAVLLFALPMCLLYVPEYVVADHYATFKGALQRNPVPAWCVLLAPAALVLCRLGAAVVKATAWDGAFGVVTVGAGAMWAVDAAIAVYIGRSIAREIARTPLIIRHTSPEIVSAFLMVCLRYVLYLHVFHIIGCGGQLTWFNSTS